MNLKKGLICLIAALVIVLIVVVVVNLGKLSSSNTRKSILINNSTSNNSAKIKEEHEMERQNYKEVLRVYNATEYIDETVIMDFEKEFKVRLEYSEFESNESMYNEIVANPDKYDVLVPSDYMIDRLIKEDRLEKIDKQKVSNIGNVASEYLAPEYDKNNDYVVPYMTGTLGILYNTKKVSTQIDSWNALFDQKYKGKILMWDSQRDCLGASLKSLGFSMNSTSEKEISDAQAKLKAQLTLAKYGEEEIRDMMIAGEGSIALMYSGEAKHAINQNHDLAYVIPKEGSNKWVDGFVIVKNTKHLQNAQNFINFMCRPNIAVRNMTQTGYTSSIKGAWAEFGTDKVMFPTTEELSRCEAFLYDKRATELYNEAWKKIR